MQNCVKHHHLRQSSEQSECLEVRCGRTCSLLKDVILTEFLADAYEAVEATGGVLLPDFGEVGKIIWQATAPFLEIACSTFNEARGPAVALEDFHLDACSFAAGRLFVGLDAVASVNGHAIHGRGAKDH